MKKILIVIITLITVTIILSRTVRDEIQWYIFTTNKIDSYESYLNNYPKGNHITEAKNSIDTILWLKAERINTGKSYQEYIKSQPNGNFIIAARAKQTILNNDTTYFLEAQKIGTRRSYENFISEFPGHKCELQARDALLDMDGRDIVDLINQNKVQVKIRGSGIKSVEIDIKRLINHEIKVNIPVGTFFICKGSAQNMVGTSEEMITLKDDDLHTVEVSAACANHRRSIPYSDDSFYIQRSPNHEGLQKLMPVLNKANVSFEIEQAAVWIVTDNATYNDLGILIIPNHVTLQGITGYRLIREYETAMAMKICDEAGIDITTKAIWKNRHKIAKGLTNEKLKNWLRDKMKMLSREINRYGF